MSFHERLKEIRTMRNMSSKEMANALGVAPSSYSQYENGKREPDVLKIKEISKILNISPDYLIFGNEINSDRYHDNLPENYNSLNDEGKKKVKDYISDLLANTRYKKNKKYTKEFEKYIQTRANQE